MSAASNNPYPRGYGCTQVPGLTYLVNTCTPIFKWSTKFSTIEVLFVKVHVFSAIILLLYQNSIKVLKDALAHLGPYQTLMEVWYSDPGGENTVPLPATIQI